MKETDPATLARSILTGRKYRHLDIPAETVIDLIRHGLDAGLRLEQAVDIAREKLHNIVAPYLGDPDYDKASLDLSRIGGFKDDTSLRNFCLTMLESHASTQERIPYLSDFYRQIFTVTGVPRTILDLACAMHPFGIPWMGLPAGTLYLAYDLHHPRVELINRFFTAAGISGEAFYGDILLHPPGQSSDVGFLFKEAHRFEQRQKGCNRMFWQALNVRWLVVSLPASNLTGRFDLVDRQRRLVSEILAGIDWPVTEIQVGNELIFCIRKENV